MKSAALVAASLALSLLVVTEGLANRTAPGDEPLPEILVSRQLLAARGLHTGDVVLLSGDPDGKPTRRFRIAGVYEPMPDPRRLTSERLEVRLHLPDLLALNGDTADPLADDTVTSINVKLTRPDDAAAFVREVTGRVPILNARPSRAGADDRNPFVVLGRFHLAIAILTVMTSAVFLLALMVMLADERRETIGTLRLMGITRTRVLKQVLAEGTMLAVAGALFGVLLAAATQGFFNALFQWRYDTSLVFVRVSASVAWRSVALAVPLGIAAVVLASWALVRSDPLRLLRR